MIDVGALTEMLLEHLRDGSDALVGDGIAPKEGGWLQGQPNKDVFRPYLVLVSQGASPRENTPWTGTDPAWAVTWSLRSFGGSRKQADWVALAGRAAVAGITKRTFGTDEHKVHALEWGGLGSVNRIDSVDPPFWQIFDTFTLVCSRSVI